MRATVLWLLVIAVITVAAPRISRAQHAFEAELKLSTAPPIVQKTRWYGYELLIVDGIAVALLVAGALTVELCIFDASPCHDGSSKFLAISGIVVYGLGAPIIHGWREHGGKAGLSFGLRASPIVLAAALAVAKVDAWPAVALVGPLLAMITDSVFVAHEEVVTPKPKRWWFNVVPALEARRRGGMLVLASRF